jgi:hypothetical protein
MSKKLTLVIQGSVGTSFENIVTVNDYATTWGYEAEIEASFSKDYSVLNYKVRSYEPLIYIDDVIQLIENLREVGSAKLVRSMFDQLNEYK